MSLARDLFGATKSGPECKENTKETNRERIGNIKQIHRKYKESQREYIGGTKELQREYKGSTKETQNKYSASGNKVFVFRAKMFSIKKHF